MYSDIYNTQLQMFLSKAHSEGVEIPSEVLEEFGDACKAALVSALKNDRINQEFRLRMSNLGRPLCQLQMEKAKAEAEPMEYNFPVKMAFGHLTEALVKALLRLANFNLGDVNATGSAEFAGQKINGEIDFTIDGGIWDVKSASGSSFKSKFVNNGITPENDPFGYLAQSVGYEEMLDKNFAGWIAVNKETGEILFAERRMSDEERTQVEKSIENAVAAISTDAPFKRCFTDEIETYYNKETGNRILGRTCGYCSYVKTCWPEAKYLPKQVGKAKDPAWFWYTHVEEKDDGTD